MGLFFRRKAIPCDVIIAGLGNPGPAYEFTRHNFGFLAVDALSQMLNLEGGFQRKWQAEVKYALVKRDRAEELLGVEKMEKSRFNERALLLMKPQTYVNLSGRAIARAMLFHKSSEVIVICDDVNLPFGHLRMRARGGAGGHKGLESIIHEVGTDEFIRIRIGVGGGELADVTNYVLERMNEREIKRGRELARLAGRKALEIAFLGFDLAGSYPF